MYSSYLGYEIRIINLTCTAAVRYERQEEWIVSTNYEIWDMVCKLGKLKSVYNKQCYDAEPYLTPCTSFVFFCSILIFEKD